MEKFNGQMEEHMKVPGKMDFKMVLVDLKEKMVYGDREYGKMEN